METATPVKKRIGRPPLPTKRSSSDYSNNPVPIHGRERKRVAVFLFKDTAAEVSKFCKASNLNQWGVINAALETILHDPDSEAYRRFINTAEEYRTKWTIYTQWGRLSKTDTDNKN